MCLYYFFQKSLFTENYSLIAAINLATRGPLYTCLVYFGLLQLPIVGEGYCLIRGLTSIGHGLKGCLDWLS